MFTAYAALIWAANCPDLSFLVPCESERCCCRHATHFIAAQGHLALASVLSLLRPPKSVVRHGITAMELLTRSAGALACEAAFGWLELPELSEEAVQSAQATAASLGAAAAKRKADAAAASCTGAGHTRPQGFATGGADIAASSNKHSQSDGDGQQANDRSADHMEGQQDEDNEQQPDQGNEQPSLEYDDDQRGPEDGNRLQNQEEYNARYDHMDDEQQEQDDDIEGYANQQDDEQQEGDLQDQHQQYDDDQQGEEDYNEQGNPDRADHQMAGDAQEDADKAEQADNQGDDWDIPERGGPATNTNRTKLAPFACTTSFACTVFCAHTSR